MEKGRYLRGRRQLRLQPHGGGAQVRTRVTSPNARMRDDAISSVIKLMFIQVGATRRRQDGELLLLLRIFPDPARVCVSCKREREREVGRACVPPANTVRLSLTVCAMYRCPFSWIMTYGRDGYIHMCVHMFICVCTGVYASTSATSSPVGDPLWYVQTSISCAATWNGSLGK